MKTVTFAFFIALSSTAFSFNHDTKIPNTSLQVKDIYGVYHGQTKVVGQFKFEIRVKKIEGSSGLIYYKDETGVRCAGRYKIRGEAKNDYFPAVVFLEPWQMSCYDKAQKVNLNVGLWIPGDKPMDGRRGPRKAEGGIYFNKVEVIPSILFKAIISN